VAHRLATTQADLEHDFTTDVAAGGARFVLSGPAVAVGERMELELNIPPGDGHFPRAGTVRGTATVLRCEPAASTGRSRWAAAVRFDEPLTLDFV